MIRYHSNVDDLAAERLVGFFVGWRTTPSPETLLRILRQSDRAIVAIDEKTEDVIGFVTVLTDGVLTAYIPLLEVLPSYQGAGVGSELLRRAVESIRDLYAVDLTCDRGLQPFYERHGWSRSVGMSIRRYENQAGASADV